MMKYYKEASLENNTNKMVYRLCKSMKLLTVTSKVSFFSNFLLSSEFEHSFVLCDRRSFSFFCLRVTSFHLSPCTLCTKSWCLCWSQSSSQSRSLSRRCSYFQLNLGKSCSLFFQLVLEQLGISLLLVYLYVLVKVFKFRMTRKLLKLCVS